MAWISKFANTKIYTDGSLDTFQWIRFVNLLGFCARWNKKSCKVHVHLLDSNIVGITEFSHCWITILEYSSLSVLHFLLTFFISAVSICGCFLVCHAFLRVTMTSLTQGTITGYLPLALIWIGNVLVYHTCKKVRIMYKYVIKFVSDLWHVSGFLQLHWFPPPIKLTATIYLKYCRKWH